MLCLLIGFHDLWAQDRTVTGTVTSTEYSGPVPGVNVTLKGTTTGTITDSEGRYSLQVPASGGFLVFSFIGLKTKEIEIGTRATVDIELSLDATELSEVVVTALNEKRDVKTLSYSAQSVNSDRLNISRANNINDALAGKIAGVQVRSQSGAALGRNSKIRIRGAGSLTDKEPLYVVDGTPVTNSSDFNPDDVESISVLKGPAGAAIYGQRGDAGVVLITTKKGTKGRGLGISINQNLFFENVYVLPRYQNSYAGGASADLIPFHYEAGMPAEWQALDGKLYPDYTDDASWGPRMNGQQYIPWYAWVPGTKYTGKTTKLVGQPNNIRDFYETGVNRSTNISFSKANDQSAVRLSYTNQGQTGIMPNTDLAKNTVAVNFSTKLSKLIEVGANVNYVNTAIHGEFDDGYSNATSGSFNQWFHRDLDMSKYKELAFLKSPEGRLVSWNHFNPTSYSGQGDKFYRGFYWYNSYAYMKLIDYETVNNRLFGDINMTLHLTDKIKAAVFYRKNQFNSRLENKRPSILPFSFQTELRPNTEAQYDYYRTAQTSDTEDNLEFLTSYADKFMNGKFSVDISAGGNLRKEQRQLIDLNTSLGLIVPDLYTINNSKNPNFGYTNIRVQKEVRSLYARGNFGYNETFFVNWTVRNDWSSALPAGANSYLYPSIGASAIFSEFTSNVLPALSYGKVRFTWAQVGSDLNAYQTQLTYPLGDNKWNGNLINAVPNVAIDPGIKPSLSSAIEYGIDLKFFKNRIGASLTLSNEKKINEILQVSTSGTTGFSDRLINAGEIKRDVIELTLDATPVQTDNFEWNVAFNLAKVDSRVVELAPGVDAIPAQNTLNVFGQNVGNPNDAFGQATIYHVAGQRWGQIKGITIQRDEQGRKVIDENGLYVPTEAPVNFGSVLPDFTGGVINSFRYMNFMMTVNIDFQKGGKYFSLSDAFGTFSGLTERTAAVNDKGNPIRDAVADGGGVHVKGVVNTQTDPEGPAIYEERDMYVDAQSYYHQFSNSGIIDPHIYDLSFVKLREVTLGYQIPVKNLGNFGKLFTSASIAFTGRNLLLLNVNKLDFDPSEVSGAFGENGGFPSTRQYGFNIRLGF